MSNGGLQQSSKRTGRPRNSGRASANPREEILHAASLLFTQQGVAATTISEIAQSVGLRQSSMYYYFKSKEEILAAVMEKNRESLHHGERLLRADGPVAPRLYAFCVIDVRQLCTAPLDFYELETSASAQPQVFEGFDDDYLSLRKVAEALIAAGVESGELRSKDAHRSALMMLANHEGAQHRLFHTLCEEDPDRRSTDIVASEVADYNVAALLADPDRIDDVRKAGLELVGEADRESLAS